MGASWEIIHQPYSDCNFILMDVRYFQYLQGLVCDFIAVKIKDVGVFSLSTLVKNSQNYLVFF